MLALKRLCLSPCNLASEIRVLFHSMFALCCNIMLFTFPSDEIAMAVQAMSCLDDDHPEVYHAMQKSVQYLRQLRKPDGSYGTVQTTALILQVRTGSRGSGC